MSYPAGWTPPRAGHRPTGASLRSAGMTFRFCDDLGRHGFSWIVEEPMTRTSHALATGEGVWLVDPVDWPEAIDRAASLGTPAGVIQLLDRHNRDAAALAERLGVPHLVVPESLPGTPFEVIEIKRAKRWQEIALWWPEPQVLVVADALGTNPFFTIGDDRIGVHPLLKLTPPRRLRALEPRAPPRRPRRGRPRAGGDDRAPPGALPLAAHGPQVGCRRSRSGCGGTGPERLPPAGAGRDARRSRRRARAARAAQAASGPRRAPAG